MLNEFVGFCALSDSDVFVCWAAYVVAVPALVRALVLSLTRFVAMMVTAILSADERTSQLPTAYRIPAAVILLC